MELEKIIGLALGVYIVYWIIKVHWINVSSTRFERQQKQRAWIKPIVDDCVKTMNTELDVLEKKYLSDKRYSRI